MGFTSQSPDINPSEHFWEYLKQEKAKHNPTSLKNLGDVINNCWKNIKIEMIREPLDCVPGRIKIVLKEKGCIEKK